MFRESIFKNRVTPRNEQGQQHGLEIDYHDSDQLKVRMIRRWVNGKRQGKSIWLFRDGVIAHIDNLKDNMMHGMCSEFFGIGDGENELYKNVTFRNGKIFGEQITYKVS